jgi:hypothetical protein
MEYLWQIFLSLHNASGGAISYSEIRAYCEVQGTLTPFEIDAIMAISATHRKQKNG